MYVCMYACKMSCYWAPGVNYAYNPLGQCTTRVLYYKAVHMFCRGTDMERHRQNATEELRDCSDRERRMVARQLETYIDRSQCLGGESQRCAQETEGHM